MSWHLKNAFQKFQILEMFIKSTDTKKLEVSNRQIYLISSKQSEMKTFRENLDYLIKLLGAYLGA